MSEPGVALLPLGESAWTLVLGDRVDRALHRRVTAIAARIASARLPGLVEIVPAYAAVTVFYEGSPEAMRGRLEEVCRAPFSGHPEGSQEVEPRLHTIPVSYAGPDLDHVARETGLSRPDIVRRHSAPEYIVYLLGFAPGFGYLGDLDPALVLPRRASPRTRVPAGSVAIAGAQTAVYPLETPGGWHLIGSTTVKLFDPAREPAALLRVGDRVRFEPLR